MTLPTNIWGALVFFIIACIFFWFVLDALRTGTAYGKIMSANYDEKPFSFVIITALNSIFALWLFYFSVTVLLQGS